MFRLVVSLEFDFSPCTSRLSPKVHSDQNFNPSTYSIPTLGQELNKIVRTERRAWLQLTKEEDQIAVSKSAKLVPLVQPGLTPALGCTVPPRSPARSSPPVDNAIVEFTAARLLRKPKTSFRCLFHPFSYSLTAARDDISMLAELPPLITRRTSRSLAETLKNWKLDLSEASTLNADSRLHRVALGLTAPP